MPYLFVALRFQAIIDTQTLFDEVTSADAYFEVKILTGEEQND